MVLARLIAGWPRCWAASTAGARARVFGYGTSAHAALAGRRHGPAPPRGPPVRQQLEGEGRGDLVGDVGHANVKVGQLRLHHVAVDNLQLVLVGGALRGGARKRGGRTRLTAWTTQRVASQPGGCGQASRRAPKPRSRCRAGQCLRAAAGPTCTRRCSSSTIRGSSSTAMTYRGVGSRCRRCGAAELCAWVLPREGRASAKGYRSNTVQYRGRQARPGIILARRMHSCTVGALCPSCTPRGSIAHLLCPLQQLHGQVASTCRRSGASGTAEMASAWLADWAQCLRGRSTWAAQGDGKHQLSSCRCCRCFFAFRCSGAAVWAVSAGPSALAPGPAPWHTVPPGR